MLLNNCELVPGVVQLDKDPEKLGRIKCVIPGILDSETMSLENMPWIYPFNMCHYQSFSKPIEGQKVWILINKSNYNEYWYMHFHEYNDKTKEYLESGIYDDDNPEVMMCRNLGDNSVLSTYDDKNGFSQRIGDNHINMWPESKIELLAGDLQIRMDGDIKCGSKGDTYQHAALGKVLKDFLQKAAEGLEDAANKSAPYAIGMKPGLTIASKALSNAANQVEAKHVQIN